MFILWLNFKARGEHFTIYLNPLNTNPTKWSNKHKQSVGKLPMNCFSVFDHFMGLALKGLRAEIFAGSYSGNLCNFGPESRNEIPRKLLILPQSQKLVLQNSILSQLFLILFICVAVTAKEWSCLIRTRRIKNHGLTHKLYNHAFICTR